MAKINIKNYEDLTEMKAKLAFGGIVYYQCPVCNNTHAFAGDNTKLPRKYWPGGSNSSSRCFGEVERFLVSTTHETITPVFDFSFNALKITGREEEFLKYDLQLKKLRKKNEADLENISLNTLKKLDKYSLALTPERLHQEIDRALDEKMAARRECILEYVAEVNKIYSQCQHLTVCGAPNIKFPFYYFLHENYGKTVDGEEYNFKELLTKINTEGIIGSSHWEIFKNIETGINLRNGNIKLVVCYENYFVVFLSQHCSSSYDLKKEVHQIAQIKFLNYSTPVLEDVFSLQISRDELSLVEKELRFKSKNIGLRDVFEAAKILERAGDIVGSNILLSKT